MGTFLSLDNIYFARARKLANPIIFRKRYKLSFGIGSDKVGHAHAPIIVMGCQQVRQGAIRLFITSFPPASLKYPQD
jgi:hypothetical protein